MKATLDRIEGDYAVLLIRPDEKQKINMPLSLMPPGSKEGDIMDITIERDEKATADAKERVTGLIEKLRNKK